MHTSTTETTLKTPQCKRASSCLMICFQKLLKCK
uniref:Uncharacterized protein n=1 Tax=Anguilla anguilla TaxID=7936 RepID=A0A0E9PZ35_ANGAN